MLFGHFANKIGHNVKKIIPVGLTRQSVAHRKNLQIALKMGIEQ